MPTDEEAAPDDQELPRVPDDEGLGLVDPNDFVEDDVFRGQGIVLPAPEGWRFDEMAFAQGVVLASPEDGLQQLAGQAVDTEELDEELDFDELLDANRDQFAVSPTVDEEIDIDGAVRAHQLRFDEIPAQQEGQAEGSLVLVLAESGDGQLAVFNYAAAVDDFEDDVAALLQEAGFDPDSDPAPPDPLPQAPAP